jgi:ribosomal protein L16/L10AE
MLMSKKTKYRKVQRGIISGRLKGARTLKFEEYAIIALAPKWLTAQ